MRALHFARRLAGVLSTRGVAAALLLGATACGSSTPSGPTAQPTPAPVKSLLTQGTFQLASVSKAVSAGFPFDAARVDFNLGSTAKLDVTVDWTFASDAVAIAVYAGSCTFSQFYANACNELGSTNPGAKPAQLSLNNLAAGSYTLIVANPGANDESGTYQIFTTR